MGIARAIAGIVLLVIGGLWTLQGSNVIAGSAMSGQSHWLYIGIVVLVAGIALLIWSVRERRRP
ncbi:hypothetical protein WH87_18125 [Devosia epidermidihirudinis]|uniref:Major facilitator superfamily (MFS) profile domain-containing protein n=1 Tax=Devosia epidermidihirudinis TaxID=1293439 RepID=A0A0F5Q390_9HYPH|nr:hypothetical protein [Devosia epidermidihirudinis]KKC35071.1 hypothetical protein WH87_18125 [Devosia epidermidihirudinis]